LSPADAGAALRVRHDLVAARCAAIADGLEEARGERVPRVLLIEGEYELSRVRGERDWLAALLADLAAKRLDWPTDWARFLAEVPMP
jgi:hypothetical protein